MLSEIRTKFCLIHHEPSDPACGDGEVVYLSFEQGEVNYGDSFEHQSGAIIAKEISQCDPTTEVCFDDGEGYISIRSSETITLSLMELVAAIVNRHEASYQEHLRSKWIMEADDIVSQINRLNPFQRDYLATRLSIRGRGNHEQ